MNKGHVEKFLAEYAKNELPADLHADVRSHLDSCKACRKWLEEIRQCDATVATVRSRTPEPSPFLKTRIDASLEALAWRPNPILLLRGRFIAAAVAVVAVVSLVFFVMPVSTSSRTQSTLDLAEIQDYAFANPDLLLAYSASPTEYNSKQILESLYGYALENEWSADPDKLYDYYKFIVSNAQEFI